MNNSNQNDWNKKSDDSNAKIRILGILLVLDGGNLPIYDKFRSTWLRYPESDSIKIFLIRYSPLVNEKVRIDHTNRSIEIRGAEPNARRGAGLVTKTLVAVHELLKIYDFDYIVRTNLSTFWYLKGLEQFLRNETNNPGSPASPQNYVCGIPNNGLMSGTCMIFSKDVAENLDRNNRIVDQGKGFEDLQLSRAFLGLGYRISSITNRYDFVNNSLVDIPNRITTAHKDGFFFFRVNNPKNRFARDSFIVERLFSYFYH